MSSEEEERSADYHVIDVAESLWSLDEDTDLRGRRCQQLMVSLVRPAPTSEEVMWKKGVSEVILLPYVIVLLRSRTEDNNAPSHMNR